MSGLIFNEAGYLAVNSDVAVAFKEYKFSRGLEYNE